MNDTVREWATKAANDFRTAERELAVRDFPNYDGVCFFSQQCVEKLMKALLIAHDVLPPKTHDLIQLNSLLAQAVPKWSWPVEDLRFLNRAAVSFRYPGETADAEIAREAFDGCSRMRQVLLELLNWPDAEDE